MQPGERAADEIAPRALETSTAATTRAVDANRPVDVVSTAGMSDIDAPRMQPNVLQRGYVIGDATHTAETTANQGPVDDVELDEAEALKTAASAAADFHSFSDE